jgi:hypothetical protein
MSLKKRQAQGDEILAEKYYKYKDSSSDYHNNNKALVNIPIEAISSGQTDNKRSILIPVCLFVLLFPHPSDSGDVSLAERRQ